MYVHTQVFHQKGYGFLPEYWHLDSPHTHVLHTIHFTGVYFTQHSTTILRTHYYYYYALHTYYVHYYYY